MLMYAYLSRTQSPRMNENNFIVYLSTDARLFMCESVIFRLKCVVVLAYDIEMKFSESLRMFTI